MTDVALTVSLSRSATLSLTLIPLARTTCLVRSVSPALTHAISLASVLTVSRRTILTGTAPPRALLRVSPAPARPLAACVPNPCRLVAQPLAVSVPRAQLLLLLLRMLAPAVLSISHKGRPTRRLRHTRTLALGC